MSGRGLLSVFVGLLLFPDKSFLEIGEGMQEGASPYLEPSYLPVEAVLTVEGLRQDKDLLGRREVRTLRSLGHPLCWPGKKHHAADNR